MPIKKYSACNYSRPRHSALNSLLNSLLKIFILFNLIQSIHGKPLKSDAKFRKKFAKIQSQTFGEAVNNGVGTPALDGTLLCATSNACTLDIVRTSNQFLYQNKIIESKSFPLTVTEPWRLTNSKNHLTIRMATPENKAPEFPHSNVTIEYGTFDAHIPGNKNAIYTHEIAFNRYDENFRTQFLSDVLKLHKNWRVVIVGEHHNRNIATEISSILFAMATDLNLDTFQLFSEANIPTKEVRYLDSKSLVQSLQGGFEDVLIHFPPDAQTLKFGKQIYKEMKSKHPQLSFSKSFKALKEPTKTNIAEAIDELTLIRSILWGQEIQQFLQQHPTSGVVIHCGAGHAAALQDYLAPFERWPANPEL